ncbi:uncharacterized [Tachysurus ichikawai]
MPHDGPKRSRACGSDRWNLSLEVVRSWWLFFTRDLMENIGGHRTSITAPTSCSSKLAMISNAVTMTSVRL